MHAKSILMGTIGRPHGVRGAVRVLCHAEDPELLEAHVLDDGRGRRFRLEWIGDGIARITELLDGGERRVEDRDAAARLTNLQLHLPRDVLPETEEDEFYLADLIGLQAVDAAGGAQGRVATVHDFGAGASLELDDGRLVPFTREAVPEIDLDAGRLVIVPPVEIEGERRDAAGDAA